MIQNKNFDKYWNFKNKKFLELIKKSQKAIKNRKNKYKKLDINIAFLSSVSKKELWQFINKLSTFINSWIDIKWTLIIISKQTKNKYLSKIVKEFRTNIDYGISISESMTQYPRVFDNLTISLISVWEKTWNLWKILIELDKKMLENIELKAKVKWALVYPIILLILTSVMVIFMMIVIIPKVTSSFAKTWTRLPWLTQIIINISNFIKNEFFIIIWTIFISIIIFYLFWKTHLWQKTYWRIAINLPIFWHIIRQSNIIYFINSFSLLMESWILLLDALKISSNVVPNIHYKREIVRIKNEVESGLTISKSMWLNLEYDTNIYTNKIFPEEFAYIVNTWEETWTITESLKKIWNNYSRELKRYIWNLSSMLEPVIIVIVWFLIWVIVIAIMLPFFELWKIAKKL